MTRETERQLGRLGRLRETKGELRDKGDNGDDIGELRG